MPHNSIPPLKVGVAGVGVMGRNHARVLSDIRDFDLTAVFDPDTATATYEDGILRVDLPLRSDHQVTRRVQVDRAAGQS